MNRITRLLALVLVGLLLAAPAMADVVSEGAGGAAGDTRPLTERTEIPGPRSAQCDSSTLDLLETLFNNGSLTRSQYTAMKLQAEEECLKAAKVAEPDPKQFKAYWKSGLRMDSYDKKFKLKIGGRIQWDWGAVFIDEDKQDAAAADPNREALGQEPGFGTRFRRARLYSEGTIYGNTIYKAQFDFAGDQVEAKDLYVGLTKLGPIDKLRFGHMKEPFGLNELTSSKYITFMERAPASEAFVPGRNSGVQVNSNFFNKMMSVGFGVFEETNDGAPLFNNVDDFNITGRVTGTPWYQDKGAKVFHLGAAATHQFRGGFEGGASQTVDFAARPASRFGNNLVDTGDILSERNTRFEFDTAFVYDGFFAIAEYLAALADVRGVSDNAYFWGAYGELGYFVNGRKNYSQSSGAFSRPKVFENFDLKKGTWGAFEFAGRVDYLDLNDEDTNIFGGEQLSFTAGANWYLNPNFRIMLNYVHASVDNRGAEDIDVEPSFNAVQGRFSLDF